MAHSMDNKAAVIPEARLRVARPMYCRPLVCSTPCRLPVALHRHDFTVELPLHVASTDLHETDIWNVARCSYPSIKTSFASVPIPSL